MPIINEEDINYALERFRSEFGREATPQAGRLIRELLNTVLNDPDPHWHPQSPYAREDSVQKLFANLPQILETIAKEQKSGPQVTASDVLHWLNIEIPPTLRKFGFVFDKK